MRCLITGGSGQLGQEWLRFLERHEGPISEFRGLNSNELDITDEEAVASEIDRYQPDLLINCAAYTQVDRAEEERDRADRVNHHAVGHLARICRLREIPMVHYSTDYVFPGRSEHRSELEEGYPEEYPTDPVNWYGETKLRGEEAIRRSGVEYLILRVSWLCGAYGSNFVTTMLRLGSEREELNVVDDQWGSPTFADNVVRNTVRLLERDRRGTYHITSEGLTNWFGVASEIFSLTGNTLRLQAVGSEVFAAEADRPRFSKLSTEKLRRVPGTEIIPWQEGLKTLITKLTD